MMNSEWPIWEVFIRSRQGLDHKHVGSLHATDAAMAIENARDVYTRRLEGVSIWVVESKYIHASNPDDTGSFYDPADDKAYRHPTFLRSAGGTETHVMPVAALFITKRALNTMVVRGLE